MTYTHSMDFFVTVDPKIRQKEKEKARKLRASNWWRQQLQAGLCYYCQDRFSADELTMDHKVPMARGGKSSKDNIVTACKACNSAKQHKTAVEFLNEK
tara:strand:+ start:328 stop:621 length:294 start_codon:yes stop_codon:yes gene_type:complete